MNSGSGSFRSASRGAAANELESLLTAVVSSADVLADGDLADGWALQRELEALEDTLQRALGVVGRLSRMVHAMGQVRQDGVGVGSPSLAGVLGGAVLELDPRFDT